MFKDINKVEDIFIPDFFNFIFENINLNEIKNSELDSSLKKILNNESILLTNLKEILNTSTIETYPRPGKFRDSGTVKEQLFIRNKFNLEKNEKKELCSINIFFEYSAIKKLNRITMESGSRIIIDPRNNTNDMFTKVSLEFGQKYINTITIDSGIFEFHTKKTIQVNKKKEFNKDSSVFLENSDIRKKIIHGIANDIPISHEDFDLLCLSDDKYFSSYYPSLPELFGKNRRKLEDSVLEIVKNINDKIKKSYTIKNNI